MPKACFALFLVFVTSDAGAMSPAKDDLLDQVNQVAGAFEVMRDCPEKVWPKYDWNNISIMLVSNPKQKGFVWNEAGSPSDVVAAPYTELPEDAKKGAYAYINWKGRATATFALEVWDQIPPNSFVKDSVISVAFHEAFHEYAQMGWQISGDSHQGTGYPVEWKFQHLRVELFKALRRAFVEPEYRNQHLAAARYWRDQLVAGFGADLRDSHQDDVIEGTARFVEYWTTALANLGCLSSVAEIAAELRRAYSQNVIVDEAQTRNLMFDVSPYELGALAGALLSETGSPNWEARTTRDETPVDILLERTDSVPQSDDANLVAEIRRIVSETNSEIGASVEPLLAELASPDFTRVAVAHSLVKGAVTGKGFVFLRTDPSMRFFLKTGFFAGLEDGSATLEVKDTTVLLRKIQPCYSSDDDLILLVPARDLRISDDTIEISNNQIQLHFPKGHWEMKTEDGGEKWLCLN